MPRPAIERKAARPTSARQRERYDRILRVVRKLTIANGEDAVQMAEVAQAADVALNTLYRYFPSKSHLYAALLSAEMQQFASGFPARSVATDAEAAANVMDLLGSAGDALLTRPRLAKAVMNASIASPAGASEVSVTADEVFEETLLRAMGVEDPTPQDRRMAYLIMVSWSGVLSAVVNERLPVGEFRPMVEFAVERFVGARSTR